VALVASPLIAAALLGGGVWEGSPPLLVPEWRGKPAQGMRTAATDPISAYRRAGAALGTYLAGIAREGGSPACGILFSEGPARPRSALQAFAEGYSETSGGVRLLVRELPASSSGASPDQNPAGTNEAPPGDARSASAKPLGPEESVREMLGADLRALFIALGPETVVAVRAASRPGLALGADYPDPSGLKALAFRIAPDSDGIVRALARELDALGEGGIEAPGIAVPAKLEVESAASALRAGDRTLAAILRSAGSRDQR
jgi:hypothetical protein